MGAGGTKAPCPGLAYIALVGLVLSPVRRWVRIAYERGFLDEEVGSVKVGLALCLTMLLAMPAWGYEIRWQEDNFPMDSLFAGVRRGPHR